MKSSDDGFTVVELVIVVLILGVLAAIVVFSARQITDSGDENACPVDQQAVEDAVDDYYADNQVMPTSIADLDGYLRRNAGARDWTIDGDGAVRPASGSECVGVAH